jgi:hypothetical protein
MQNHPPGLVALPRHATRGQGGQIGALVAALILALAPIPKDAPTNPAGIVTAKMWAALAQCETGNNLAHNTRSYITALGMAKGTFNNWGGTRGDTRSWLRTMEVAERVAWYGHYNVKQKRFVWAVGPWGWGCLRKGGEAHRLLCANHTPVVKRWHRDCAQFRS